MLSFQPLPWCIVDTAGNMGFCFKYPGCSVCGGGDTDKYCDEYSRWAVTSLISDYVISIQWRWWEIAALNPLIITPRVIIFAWYPSLSGIVPTPGQTGWTVLRTLGPSVPPRAARPLGVKMLTLALMFLFKRNYCGGKGAINILDCWKCTLY